MMTAKLGKARPSAEDHADPPGNGPDPSNPIGQLISETRGSSLSPAGNGGNDG
jgi:hypothetical protein